MQINRFLALAAIALLVVAAMGAVTAQSYAQTATPPASATVQTQQSEPAEVAGPDLTPLNSRSAINRRRTRARKPPLRPTAA